MLSQTNVIVQLSFIKRHIQQCIYFNTSILVPGSVNLLTIIEIIFRLYPFSTKNILSRAFLCDFLKYFSTFKIIITLIINVNYNSEQILYFDILNNKNVYYNDNTFFNKNIIHNTMFLRINKFICNSKFVITLK